MPLISPIIETIVATISNGVYLRATAQEANIEADELDLIDKILIIYNNLPDVTNEIGPGGNVIAVWPVEIEILKLADFDDNTADGDLIRADCLRIANYILDSFPENSVEIIETYQTDFLDEVKVYDKTMSGVRLTFDYPLRRLDYCDDLNP